MVARLYLLADSFKYNGTDSEDKILDKIKALCSDLLYITQYKEENIVIIDTKIYTTFLFEQKTIFEICTAIDRDSRNLLFSIINSAKEFVFHDVVAECHAHDTNKCAAILAFNPIRNIPEDTTIIYNKNNWFSFRRIMLGLYPQEANYFMEECKKYFIDLFFHENNKRVIGEYLHDYSLRFVEYLSCLNDNFRRFFEEHKNMDNTNVVLELFSRTHKMDDEASLQGNSAKKRNITYQFTYNDGVESKSVDLCCEPHLKIKWKNNQIGKGNPKHIRIYFHMGQKYVENGRILVGSIGPHVV